MAEIEKRLIHFNSEETFKTRKSDIKDTSIAFIKDGQKIYTHGQIYEAVPEGGEEGQVLVRDAEGNLVWQDNTIFREGNEDGDIITSVVIYDDEADDENDGLLKKSDADKLYQSVGDYVTFDDVATTEKNGVINTDEKKILNAEKQMGSVLSFSGTEFVQNAGNKNALLIVHQIVDGQIRYGQSITLKPASSEHPGIMPIASFTKLEGLPSSVYSKSEIDSTVSDLEESIDEKQPKFEVGTGLELKEGTLNVTLDTTIFKVVEALPDKPATGDENKLHLVLSTASETGNLYEEYLYVNNKWELLGKFKAEIDLTPYLKIEDIEEEVSDAGFAKTTEVTNAIEASWDWAEL